MTSLFVEAFAIAFGVVWVWWSFVRLVFWVMGRYATWRRRVVTTWHWAMFTIASAVRKVWARSPQSPPKQGPYR